MKKIFLILIVMVSLSLNLTAQNMRTDKPNVVTLELLGKCGGYSFNYDRNFAKFIGAGLGVFYGPNSKLFNIPVYANFYLGGDSISFLVQGGAKVNNYDIDSKGNSEVGVKPYFGLGFETRKAFVFRLMIYYNYVNIGDGTIEGWIPWPGFSFGAAF